MPMKEWAAVANGHNIRVVNTWTGGTNLYIDGECRDRNTGRYAIRKTLWLSAPLTQGDPESGLVQVFVKAIFTVKAQILVSGKPIGGDEF
jgi:hypothetical protein